MTIAIRELLVPRHNRLVYNGQAVTVIAEVADVGIISILLALSTSPTITIYDPNGTVIVDNIDMSYSSTGVYLYTYQTTPLDDMGVYTVDINATYGGYSARLTRVVAFKIIDTRIPPVFPQFTYLGIKDQTGVVWYWLVAVDGTADFTSSIPIVVGKSAVAIVESTEPYWIEVLDDNDDIRYVYPHITGEYIVTATQPPVGLGLSASPTWIGLDGSYFILDVSTAEEAVMIRI